MLHREFDSYAGAAIGPVVQGDLAAVVGDNALADDQSEAAAVFLGRNVRFESVPEDLVGKTGSVVFKAYDEIAAVVIEGRN